MAHALPTITITPAQELILSTFYGMQDRDALLTIIPEDLQQKGLDPQPWMEFLQKEHFSPNLRKLTAYSQQQIAASTSRDPKAIAIFQEQPLQYALLVENLGKELATLKGNKNWRRENRPEFFVHLLCVMQDIADLDKMTYQEEESLVIPQRPVFLYLRHLLIHRLAELRNKSQEFTFFEHLSEQYLNKRMIFVKEQGWWSIMFRFNYGNPHMPLGQFRAALFDENSELVTGPSVTVSFIIAFFEPKTMRLFQQSIATETPMDLTQCDLRACVTYNWESPHPNGRSNSLMLVGQFEKNGDCALVGPAISQIPPDVPAFQKEIVLIRAQQAVDYLKEEWFAKARRPWTLENCKHDQSIIFPETPEEHENIVREILRLALLAPKQNALLLASVAEELGISTTEEEIEGARQVLHEESTPIDEEGVEVSPKVFAHILQKKLDLPMLAPAPPADDKAREGETKSAPAFSTPHQPKSKKMQHAKPRRHSDKTPPKPPPQPDPKLDLRPLNLKVKVQSQVDQVLHGKKPIKKDAFKKLVYRILQRKAEARKAKIDIRPDGADIKIHLRKRQDGTLGVGEQRRFGFTYCAPHGSDASRGGALSLQRKTLSELLGI